MSLPSQVVPAIQGRRPIGFSRAGAILLVLLAAAPPAAAQQAIDAGELDRTLARVAERVERWYARAQSIVAEERVAVQPLRYDLVPDGFPRRLTYELRVAWLSGTAAGAGPLPEANVLRHLVAVNGRPPRPEDEPGCMDPKPVSPEPLGMLLPPRRGGFDFSLAGTTRVDRRPALIIDFESVETGPPDVRWRDDCVTVSLPGRSRGRIWIDAATYDVLRLDERLVGSFEFDVPDEYVRRGAARSMTVERSETSIRYRRVDFADPTETLLLPETIDTLTIIRGGGMQRYRITQRFSDYRRFLTSGRIVE